MREFDSFKWQKVPQSLSGLYFFAKILLNNIAYYYVLWYNKVILSLRWSALRIKKSRSKNSVSYAVIKDITRNGKRTTKIVETLGNHEEIKQKHPEMDPEEWAKQRAAELTEQEKQKKQKIAIHYDPTKKIKKDKQQLFNVGYLFLQSILAQLKLPTMTKKIAKQHQFKYPLDQILSCLIYNRILSPASKKKCLWICPNPIRTASISVTRYLPQSWCLSWTYPWYSRTFLSIKSESSEPGNCRSLLWLHQFFLWNRRSRRPETIRAFQGKSAEPHCANGIIYGRLGHSTCF